MSIMVDCSVDTTNVVKKCGSVQFKKDSKTGKICKKYISIHRKSFIQSNSRLIEYEKFVDYSLEELYDEFYFPHTSIEYKEYRKSCRCNELCIKKIGGKEEIVMCNELGIYELSDGSNKCLEHYDGNGEEIGFSCIGSNCYKNANVGPPFNSMFKIRCYKHKLSSDTTKNILVCQTKGCSTFASYGFQSTKPVKCISHIEPKMEYVLRRKCIHPGCESRAIYKDVRYKYNIYCETHKKDGTYKATKPGKVRKEKIHLDVVLKQNKKFLLNK